MYGRLGVVVLVVIGVGACSSVERPVPDPAPDGTGGSVGPGPVRGAAGGTGGSAADVTVMGGAGGKPVAPAVDASPPPPPPRPSLPAAGTCADLEAAYLAGVETAKACDPSAIVPQCTLRVISSLDCGCSIFVNDTAAPTAARLAWDHVPCPAHGTAACLTPCMQPGPVRCIAIADGTGRCAAVEP